MSIGEIISLTGSAMTEFGINYNLLHRVRIYYVLTGEREGTKQLK